MNQTIQIRNIPSPLERVVDRWAEHLVPWVPNSVRPNQITWMGTLIGLFGGFCFWLSFYWEGYLLIALLCILLHTVTDSLDGAVARLRNQGSLQGKFLDHMLDALVFLAWSVGLGSSSYAHMSFALMIIILVNFHNFLMMLWINLTQEWQNPIFGAVDMQVAFVIIGVIAYCWTGRVLSFFEYDLRVFDLAIVGFSFLSVVDFCQSCVRLYLKLGVLDRNQESKA